MVCHPLSSFALHRRDRRKWPVYKPRVTALVRATKAASYIRLACCNSISSPMIHKCVVSMCVCLSCPSPCGSAIAILFLLINYPHNGHQYWDGPQSPSRAAIYALHLHPNYMLFEDFDDDASTHYNSSTPKCCRRSCSLAKSPRYQDLNGDK